MIGDPGGRTSERQLLDIAQIDANVQGIAGQLDVSQDAMVDRLDAMRDGVERRLDLVRGTLDTQLRRLQEDNAMRLEQMRVTVDEKLHAGDRAGLVPALPRGRQDRTAADPEAARRAVGQAIGLATRGPSG